MNKVSAPISNDFCPQTMFLYGTRMEDGSPNFGLFCWFSYCWDGGLSVMASIGGPKATKRRIEAEGVFSANLVTRDLVPLADALGNTAGDDPAKRALKLAVTPGPVLGVPMLNDSPLGFELEVRHKLPLDGSDLYVCTVRNVLAADFLLDKSVPVEERLRLIGPAATTHMTYFDMAPKALGDWGGFPLPQAK